MELGSSSFSSSSSSSGKNSASAADSSLSIGLKIGQEGYVKSGNGSSAAGAGAGAPSSPAKKGRSGGAAQGGQPPRCQVEGCNADLSDAKAYYSRHKVCAMHSKSPTVIVAGLEQRFCQQCSRFHQLPEFDQGKRSCRRRLAGHNERRRKPPPGTLFSARYGSLSSPLFDNSSKGSGAFLMDFTSYQNPSGRDSSWADPRAFGQAAWDGRPAPPTGRFLQHGWQSNSDDTTPPELLLQASPFPGPANNVHPSSGECFDGVPSSNRALSLLSSQPLGLEVTSFLGADGTPASGSQGAGLNGFSEPQWGFKVSQGSSSSGDGHYSGDLGMAHQTENVREYMGLEQSTRGYDSSMQNMHWTL